MDIVEKNINKTNFDMKNILSTPPVEKIQYKSCWLQLQNLLISHTEFSIEY